MTFEQIVSLLEISDSKAESLKAYVEESSKITPEKANEWISEKGSEGYMWFRPLVDREVSKGVETAVENFKNEKLETIVEQRLKEINPELDPKDKKVMDLEKALNEMKAESNRKEMKTKVLELTKGKLYDGFNFDSLIGEDQETTVANCEKALESFSSYMKPFEEVKAKMEIQNPAPKNGNASADGKADLKTHFDSILNK